MFGRKKNPGARIDTLIAAGTRIEGNLIVSGGVHLAGYVKGNVTTAPDATAFLSIAPQGVVEGVVEVARVIVDGEVRGDIRASERVELGATARVSGDVAYGIIELAAGATIQGRLFSIGNAGEPKKITLASPAPLRPVGTGES
jgi:cytoskeletal protein CcmA (bactofilin family)